MNKPDAWLHKLRCLQLELDHLILATPSGEVRNKLCDLNIELNCISAMPNPLGNPDGWITPLHQEMIEHTMRNLDK